MTGAAPAATLPDAARALLDVDGSLLATVLRHQLIGLQAALRAAAAEHPDDPGVPTAERLLTWLDGLALTGVGPRAERTPTSAVTGSPPATGGWWQTLSALDDRPDAPRGWLGTTTADHPPDELARVGYLAALRLPAASAAVWRAQLDRSAPPPPDGPWQDLPGTNPQVLLPPSGTTPGLRVRTGAALDPQIATVLGLDVDRNVDPGPDAERQADAAELAEIATVLLRVVELDRSLWLALASLRHRGMTPFDASLVAAYRRDLLDRLGEYRATDPGTPTAFSALLAVDEATNSVLYRPVAAPGSWWADLQQRSRALVLRAQRSHPGVAVRLLAYRYRDAADLTDGTDVGVQASYDGSRAGEILACLRLWARVGDEVRPGRVVFAG